VFGWAGLLQGAGVVYDRDNVAELDSSSQFKGCRSLSPMVAPHTSHDLIQTMQLPYKHPQQLMQSHKNDH
jgi:hypothetical protein